MVWTVRAGAILTLLDLDGAAMDGAVGEGISMGGAVVTGPEAGWPGVVRHEPPAGSSPGMRAAFWSGVTADA